MTIQHLKIENPVAIKMTRSIIMYFKGSFFPAALALLILFCLTSSAGSAPSEVKTISGIGSGELLLLFTIHSAASVFSGEYSYDLVGLHVPPIDVFNMTSTNEAGYSYSLPGVFIPGKPNDFSVSASPVKTLNIGVKKHQGSYENSSTIWAGKSPRVWITSQVIPDENGTATTSSDLLSPGAYQIKIFGDAAENASQVDLTMTLIKKLIVNGNFNLSINTTGFPSGSYDIEAKALNGSIYLDKIAVKGISV
jgi:hypothetical protein